MAKIAELAADMFDALNRKIVRLEAELAEAIAGDEESSRDMGRYRDAVIAAEARVAALEAALRDLLDDVGEVTGERHHRDKYRVYQISPQTMTAARAVLTPASPPYPWCRQPSVCRGTCPMDPSCGE